MHVEEKHVVQKKNFVLHNFGRLSERKGWMQYVCNAHGDMRPCNSDKVVVFNLQPFPTEKFINATFFHQKWKYSKKKKKKKKEFKLHFQLSSMRQDAGINQ